MTTVAITMRRDPVAARHEIRDGLETAWWDLLATLGHVPLILPNHLEHARALINNFRPGAALLTGGGSPAESGALKDQRDEVERLLMDYAFAENLPVLGVCRGMQTIALNFGGSLQSVAGHVGRVAAVTSRYGTHDAHCFHERTIVTTPEGFTTFAETKDGIVEAIEHKTRPIRGMMWHPERATTLSPADRALLQDSLR